MLEGIDQAARHAVRRPMTNPANEAIGLVVVARTATRALQEVEAHAGLAQPLCATPGVWRCTQHSVFGVVVALQKERLVQGVAVALAATDLNVLLWLLRHRFAALLSGFALVALALLLWLLLLRWRPVATTTAAS